MNFVVTSRRDDIISMCYLLLTLLNNFKFPCIKDNSPDPMYDVPEIDTKTKFKAQMKIKEENSLVDFS